MNADYRINSLPAESFTALFQLSEEALGQRSMTRLRAETQPGFPCRVSLEDARPGESLLALTFQHHDVNGPYRASGPIFVREGATQTRLDAGTIPEFLLHRQLSLRCYDSRHAMVAADVVAGTSLASILERRFRDPRIRLVHIHNAAQGCYLCAAERVK